MFKAVSLNIKPENGKIIFRTVIFSCKILCLGVSIPFSSLHASHEETFDNESL